MDWNKIVVPGGAKLFKIHNFTFMHKGNSYHIEVDAFADGSFTGHGEHSTDKSSIIESVSGTSAEECINELIKRIESR